VTAASIPVKAARPAPTLPDKPSIAVLPFTNMSGDPEQSYFADGMAEEIITALSRCKWLFVIARNSSFTYKDKTADVREVGHDLGVRYVLEGSVRRAGNRLRFTVQLVDAISGAQIWADRFDGEMSDVFDLEDRITERVVGSIEPKVQQAEMERLRHKPVANLNAYDLLLRAQQLAYEYTEQSSAAAIRCLKQALAIDATYAPAMALAAYCFVERRFQGWAENLEAEATEGRRLALRAVDLALRAVDLAGDDAEVLWMAAHALRALGGNRHRAKELFDLSLHLSPNSAMALTAAAWLEAVLANPAGALELLRRAERMSPRDPRAWVMAAAAALSHFLLGQFKEAEASARKALARNPRYARTLRILAASLAKLGEREKAAEAIQEVLAIEPQLTISEMRTRSNYMDEGVWKKLSEAWRLAGLPE
jgi:TolB-like protein/tetratricopeptide (TPR) repeat protein